MADLPTPAERPIVAERFALEDEVHAGGMARVYRARDARSGEVVAVKRPLRDDAGELERFRQESAIVAELSHPAIVRHVAHGAASFESAFLAMEWLAGETLFDRLERGPLGVAEAVSIARRAAEALGAAHRARIVHRDVKPANIMLCGDRDELKLLDFGIARREHGGGLATHSSFAGGTWAYMSPEQVMGAAELGARTDVFSLGCVLFECLSGVPAYPSERSAAIVAKVWKEPPALVDRCQGVPPKLGALLAKLLAKDPLARPRDGTAVASELAALGRLPETAATPR